jgi:hypothetical protein
MRQMRTSRRVLIRNWLNQCQHVGMAALTLRLNKRIRWDFPAGTGKKVGADSRVGAVVCGVWWPTVSLWREAEMAVR